MTLLIIVGIAFLLFCVVAVFVITAIAQPPNKAVEYYTKKGTGTTGAAPSASDAAASKPVEPGL